MSDYDFTPETLWVSSTLTFSEKVVRRRKCGLPTDRDVVEAVTEDLLYIQSLFGIDPHLTMASW